MDNTFNKLWDDFINNHKRHAQETIYQEVQQAIGKTGNWGGHVGVAAVKACVGQLVHFHQTWMDLAKEIWSRSPETRDDARYLQHFKNCQAAELKLLEDLGGKAAQFQVHSWDELGNLAHTQELKVEAAIQNWRAKDRAINAGNSPRGRVPQSGKCFVVIASDKNDGSTTHEDRYKKAIELGVKESGNYPIRNVDGGHPNWFTEMVGHLRTCELAVVDLTDLRPNCIWELGILNAWDVPVLLIQPKNMDLPSDIFSQRISVFYVGQTPQNLDELRTAVREKIKTIMSHSDRGKFLP